MSERLTYGRVLVLTQGNGTDEVYERILELERHQAEDQAAINDAAFNMHPGHPWFVRNAAAIQQAREQAT